MLIMAFIMIPNAGNQNGAIPHLFVWLVVDIRSVHELISNVILMQMESQLESTQANSSERCNLPSLPIIRN